MCGAANDSLPAPHLFCTLACMALKVRVYSDGGARGNPGPAAIGIWICDMKGTLLREHKERIGEATNNVAEYSAVIVGLELAKSLGADVVEYFVDSELVARQLSGDYRVKAPHLRGLFEQVQRKREAFRHVTFTHVPRTHPQIDRVDRLVNEALDEDAGWAP